MFLTDLSIKRPVVASVMSLVLVIFGLFTFNEIPTDELPDVQPPVVTIQTEYKGASAEIIDTQITGNFYSDYNLELFLIFINNYPYQN